MDQIGGLLQIKIMRVPDTETFQADVLACQGNKKGMLVEHFSSQHNYRNLLKANTFTHFVMTTLWDVVLRKRKLCTENFFEALIETLKERKENGSKGTLAESRRLT